MRHMVFAVKAFLIIHKVNDPHPTVSKTQQRKSFSKRAFFVGSLVMCVCEKIATCLFPGCRYSSVAARHPIKPRGTATHSGTRHIQPRMQQITLGMGNAFRMQNAISDWLSFIFSHQNVTIVGRRLMRPVSSVVLTV